MTDDPAADMFDDLDRATHEYADIFPPMDAAEFDRLVDSMTRHGFDEHEPVLLYEGKILDGRHRLLAAREAGVEPIVETFDGTDREALDKVQRRNLDRRHLTTAQKAAVAADLKQRYADRAKARQREGGRAGGKGMENLPDPSTDTGTAREQAGKQVGVSGRTVDKADSIRDEAPDVHERMKRGDYGSVSAAERVAELDDDKRHEVHRKVDDGDADSPDDALHELKREQRRAERIEQTQQLEQEEPPGLDDLDQRFALVYADPPWQYEHTKTDNRRVENHYPTMDLDDIRDLPVDEIAADQAYLYLWTTPPKCHHAIDVLQSWGFEYRTQMIWDKAKIGMGYYARQRHEVLLIGRRGTPPAPEQGERPASVYREERGEHSAKPDHFYDMLETLYPDYSKIELFARNDREGWHSWGNEANNEPDEPIEVAAE